jgi:hypothetical protein
LLLSEEQVLAKITRLVPMKMLQRKPKSHFEKVELFEYVLDQAKKLNLKIVGIGGKDLLDGSKGALALMQQLFVYDVTHFYERLCPSKKTQASLEETLEWANTEVRTPFAFFPFFFDCLVPSRSCPCPPIQCQ